jgi:hypothetical protein
LVTQGISGLGRETRYEFWPCSVPNAPIFAPIGHRATHLQYLAPDTPTFEVGFRSQDTTSPSKRQRHNLVAQKMLVKPSLSHVRTFLREKIVDLRDNIRVQTGNRLLPWFVALGIAAIVVGASLALVFPEDTSSPQVTVSQ